MRVERVACGRARPREDMPYHGGDPRAPSPPIPRAEVGGVGSVRLFGRLARRASWQLGEARAVWTTPRKPGGPHFRGGRGAGDAGGRGGRGERTVRKACDRRHRGDSTAAYAALLSSRSETSALHILGMRCLPRAGQLRPKSPRSGQICAGLLMELEPIRPNSGRQSGSLARNRPHCADLGPMFTKFDQLRS